MPVTKGNGVLSPHRACCSVSQCQSLILADTRYLIPRVLENELLLCRDGRRTPVEMYMPLLIADGWHGCFGEVGAVRCEAPGAQVTKPRRELLSGGRKNQGHGLRVR